LKRPDFDLERFFEAVFQTNSREVEAALDADALGELVVSDELS